MDNSRRNTLFDAPTAQEIAAVVADIVRAVKADFRLTNMALAAALKLDSPNSVKNLEEEKIAKVPASLISNIRCEYGIEYIQPYMALFGCRAVPMHCEEAVDALPALTALAAKMAASIHNGRHEIDHTALAAMLPELRKVDGVISALRARAGDLGMIA